MTSLWRHLWPDYDTLDFKILTQCVKMLGERVLQVWCWYLHWFRRYRKKTRGGLEIAPPVGRGLSTYWQKKLSLFQTCHKLVGMHLTTYLWWLSYLGRRHGLMSTTYTNGRIQPVHLWWGNLSSWLPPPPSKKRKSPTIQVTLFWHVKGVP